MLDHLVVCQRIPPYYSIFVTCLKLISNALSVYLRILAEFFICRHTLVLYVVVSQGLNLHVSAQSAD